MKSHTATTLLTLAGAAILSFVPACTEVHNEVPARGSSSIEQSTRREETTYREPGTTITREREEEIRR